ncbi:MAG: DUF805 domain-containing protein [Devosia sp.]
MNGLLQNYMGFEGRLNRQRWWISGIVLGIIQFIVMWIVGLIIPGSSMDPAAFTDPNAMMAMMGRIGWQSLIFGIIFAYPWLSITVKRRHDRNNNGYDAYGFVAVELLYYLVLGLGGLGFLGGVLGFVFLIYAIYILVVCGFQKGTAGANTYGPDPLGG